MKSCWTWAAVAASRLAATMAVGMSRATSMAKVGPERAAQRAFGDAKRDALPRYCRECEVLGMCNGGCPKYRFIETADGEPGLNYLCAGLKRFFLHSRDPLVRMASQQPPARGVSPVPMAGRNDPCPCGSGLKFKKCCGGR